MSSVGSQRRRSGVWDSEVAGMEKEAKRHRWPGSKEKLRKEPSAYDEWLLQEKEKHLNNALAQSPDQSTAEDRPKPPRRNQSSTTAASTIRAVTPELDTADSIAPNVDHSIGRPFTPHNASVNSPKSSGSPRGSSKTRRLIKERNAGRDGRPSTASPPGSTKEASTSGGGGISFLNRRGSRKGSGQRSRGMTEGQEVEPVPPPPTRPRTKTMEEQRRREPSPGIGLLTHKGRAGSIHATTSSQPSQSGAEYSAAFPMATQAPPPPLIPLARSPAMSPSDQSRRRSTSPPSSGTVGSIPQLPAPMQNRIAHLRKTLNGQYVSKILCRRDARSSWMDGICSIESSGQLIFEPTENPHARYIMISHLPGIIMTWNTDNEPLNLQVRSPVTREEVHLQVEKQYEFNSWYAALLHWQSPDVQSTPDDDHRPISEVGPKSPTNAGDASLHQRRSSANNTRSRASSNRSDRRRSFAAPSATKENPVIKIGKMVHWDTVHGYTNGSTTSLGQMSTVRSTNYMMQAAGHRRWRRISGQLRENGELKLHADIDNSLILVVHLSQLSRCAIQRLDPSVLESDFCIAIYPQYTSSYATNEQSTGKPIFLSLENRVLFEVWFVLLRAFTMPSIYGPRTDGTQDLEGAESDVNQDLENMIATSDSFAFRMERSLSVRIVEARMISPTVGLDGVYHGGSSKQLQAGADRYGYYAEVLLDGETRGKTVVKHNDLTHPVWFENFEFQDLPPVLQSASVIIRRRPSEQILIKERDVRQMPDTHADQQGVVASLGFDTSCGKVEFQLDELDPEKHADKWWPAFNMHGLKVGEVLINARAQEGIVLMARDYRPLGDILHRFDNGLTLQLAEMIPSELKRLSECLVDIFQVSGRITEWIMALIEEEIDGLHKDTPITRLRYTKRTASESTNDLHGTSAGSADRELMVRDMGKSATVEANLLFRGNTLLTRALDTHMRRVGKEWLEYSLADILHDIVAQDADCEVDPSRAHAQYLHGNQQRLLVLTQQVWQSILVAGFRCPLELRFIFRHIRTCAEDRYGDFLRTVQYSSVSGFLFLRFFCPAVLNPNLFGLMKGDIKPRTRRTFTLIAKSLQTMANTASFGAKEPWMSFMNAFIYEHREKFKAFIDDVCHVPEPISHAAHPRSPTGSPTYPPEFASVERHMSYTTPVTIMQRLPPSSREGFPSLPYLIDQARAYADLIQLWLESTEALSRPAEISSVPVRTRADILNAIRASKGELETFHDLCETLSARTQECLARAERADRPESVESFQIEDVIDQLRETDIASGATVLSSKDIYDALVDRITTDASILHNEDNIAVAAALAQLRGQPQTVDAVDMDDTRQHSTLQQQYHPFQQHESPRPYDAMPSSSSVASSFVEPASRYISHEGHSIVASASNPSIRPGSANAATSSSRQAISASREQARPYLKHRTATSPGHSASASVSNLSTSHMTIHSTSGSTTDTEREQSTTALPSYEREIRHRERREAARLEIQQQIEAKQNKEKERDREKKKLGGKFVASALRKNKKERTTERDDDGRGLMGT